MSKDGRPTDEAKTTVDNLMNAYKQQVLSITVLITS